MPIISQQLTMRTAIGDAMRAALMARGTAVNTLGSALGPPQALLSSTLDVQRSAERLVEAHTTLSRQVAASLQSLQIAQTHSVSIAMEAARAEWSRVAVEGLQNLQKESATAMAAALQRHLANANAHQQFADAVFRSTEAWKNVFGEAALRQLSRGVVQRIAESPTEQPLAELLDGAVANSLRTPSKNGAAVDVWSVLNLILTVALFIYSLEYTDLASNATEPEFESLQNQAALLQKQLNRVLSVVEVLSIRTVIRPVDLREGTGSGSRTLRLLQRGEEVFVIQRAGKWTRVRAVEWRDDGTVASSTVGWVLNKYLRRD
jgi:hypothetical protein